MARNERKATQAKAHKSNPHYRTLKKKRGYNSENEQINMALDNISSLKLKDKQESSDDDSPKFTLFNALPSELRIMIWKEALHIEEVLNIKPDFYTSLSCRKSASKARLMNVNREARAEAQKVLKQFRGRGLFNPETDAAWYSVLFLCNEAGLAFLDRDLVRKISVSTEYLAGVDVTRRARDIESVYTDIAILCKSLSGNFEVVILLGSLALDTYGVVLSEYGPPCMGPEEYCEVYGRWDLQYGNWEDMEEGFLKQMRIWKKHEGGKWENFINVGWDERVINSSGLCPAGDVRNLTLPSKISFRQVNAVNKFRY
ncbi:hypothetical protein ONS95_001286 [Cadophora gregata]|uniref:uncharacterized protein n=1 Tax=Cadophora gregata TaxID=51156 RepID=UPI0026DD8366|nr:uncharacterized protein ONS95_001286 [Cadophora gregata]KAK0129359.1 hypothetical protein ONS95_001286 [Cadophora gregata]